MTQPKFEVGDIVETDTGRVGQIYEINLRYGLRGVGTFAENQLRAADLAARLQHVLNEWPTKDDPLRAAVAELLPVKLD